MILKGDSLDLILKEPGPFDLVVTDPPYAFGGSGDEHELSATVAVVLRETAIRVKPGGWMLIFCASSWRSTTYMAESVRGILQPVRIGHWLKPKARTKTRTSGWQWASVHVLACRKGSSSQPPGDYTDHITEPPTMNGRRAELPLRVALWAVEPFAVPGGSFLDPFCGSGALVHAATTCGMLAKGFEKAHPEAD